MAPRTRAKAPSKPEPVTSSVSKHTLPAASSNPPQILILPNKATCEARVTSLINPRYSKPTRYLICPETGAYEFLKIAAPKTTPRSWLIADATTASSAAQDETSTTTFDAQVTKGADLYLATPIDPLFLALPALAAQFSSTSKRMFLASDDHLETAATDDCSAEAPAHHHLRDTLARWPAWRTTFEARMVAACDVVQGPGGPDDMLFRFSEEKLLRAVLDKAKRISAGGALPRSMEDKFVGKALEAPVLRVKRSAGVAAPPLTTEASRASSGGGAGAESLESQSSVATSATGGSEASTAATSVADGEDGAAVQEVSSAITASAAVIALQRLRVAFNFICSSYVPPAMATELKKMLLAEDIKELVDFTPLDDYVAQLGKLRQEALLARSASDYSRKRGSNEEENEERAEKRRKKEEDDKRKKAGESLGVKKLKKVNTAGMQKLSAFFKPKGS